MQKPSCLSMPIHRISMLRIKRRCSFWQRTIRAGWHWRPCFIWGESSDSGNLKMTRESTCGGGKATIKWHAPSCHDLICRATVAESRWSDYARRLQNHQRVAPTVQIDMFNGNTKVAEAQFTYWAQDIESLRKDAYDPVKISFCISIRPKPRPN